MLRLPCQSFKTFRGKEIHEYLFDKQCDRRYLESAVQKFQNLNKEPFRFLGLDIELNGTGNDLAITFHSSNMIGAIPVKLPYDGMKHKDIQIVPRFDNQEEAYSELTQLLSCLEHTIEPEYLDDELLCAPMQLRPPLYYEAAKYVTLFEKACKHPWLKFDVREQDHSYPKSSTDWAKHAKSCFDPRKSLVFPSHDNLLSTNHKEWRELRYVFDLAKDLIQNSSVPNRIRYEYDSILTSVSSRISTISPLYTNNILLHASDPVCIKDTKNQANVILQQTSNQCAAWRVDMAVLFERYIQAIVQNAVQNLSGSVVSNEKIHGAGRIPHWGLKYLEPDIVIRLGSELFMADAKYKAHFYAQATSSDILKETHRADIHQLLAYCAFEPQKAKTGILFYPARETKYNRIRYTDRLGGICNHILLCGVAFGYREMFQAGSVVREMLRKEVLMH